MTATPKQPNPATRILCVDDEPAVRDLLALYLRRNNFEVETARDGFAAWQLVAQDLARFDVVITDNQMPNLEGIDLVEKLRANGYAGRIVFFSSTLAPQGAERLGRLRVDAVVEKGRPLSQLMAALRASIAK